MVCMKVVFLRETFAYWSGVKEASCTGANVHNYACLLRTLEANLIFYEKYFNAGDGTSGAYKDRGLAILGEVGESKDAWDWFIKAEE